MPALKCRRASVRASARAGPVVTSPVRASASATNVRARERGVEVGERSVVAVRRRGRRHGGSFWANRTLHEHAPRLIGNSYARSEERRALQYGFSL